MSTDWQSWLDQSGWAKLWPQDTDAVLLNEVDSTMAEADRRTPVARPTWIMARRQTEARGRRGRSWAQPDGNFGATLVFRPNRPAREAALTSFVAAIALHDTLTPLAIADRARVRVKWPNDVLIDRCKVAGILLAASGQGDQVDRLSVGIGINLVAGPPVETLEPQAVPPISLADADGSPDIFRGPHACEEILVHLAHNFAYRMSLWDEFGFDIIRSTWLSAHGARKGQRLTARMPGETVTGAFETLDDDGRLVLDTGQGLRKIAAADVFYD